MRWVSKAIDLALLAGVGHADHGAAVMANHGCSADVGVIACGHDDDGRGELGISVAAHESL